MRYVVYAVPSDEEAIVNSDFQGNTIQSEEAEADSNV